MKKNLFIALAIGGLMVTSCSEDVYVEPDHESFSKDFTEIFGRFRPMKIGTLLKPRACQLQATATM